jgi:acyl carrier protein
MEFSKFLTEFCGQFEDENIKINGTDKFRELDAWDSLTGMAVLYMIDTNYGVAIPPDDFIKLQTPEGIFDYIKTRTAS